MEEHLQRALIEVYYAIAEFNQGYAAMPSTEERAEKCARLTIIRANLERLILAEQGVETKHAA